MIAKMNEPQMDVVYGKIMNNLGNRGKNLS